MKMLREIVDTMVLFQKSAANPIVVNWSGGTLKVNRVMKVWKERRSLRNCIIYQCMVEGRENPVELRWDTESNIWFIEKL